MPRYCLILFTLFLLIPTAIVSYWYSDIIYSLNLILIAISIIFGCAKRSSLSTTYKILHLYIIIIYLSEMTSAFSAYFLKTNMLVSHVLLPIQLIVFSWFLFCLFNQKKSTKFYWLITLAFLVLAMSTLSAIQGVDKFNSIGIILFSMIAISSSLFSLKKIALTVNSEKLQNKPVFWFSIGNLAFYSITFFIYGFLWMPGIKPDWTYTLITTSNLFMSACYFLTMYTSVKSLNPA